jgi:hypothetical protein
MNINKKTRAELKGYFKKNAIPTEGNFVDFIEAGVNQQDDGLYKPPGEPLSLEAKKDGVKPAIQFYETFAGNASWMVSLAIPSSPPGSTTPAFAVSDGNGTPRLWIEQTGAVTVPGAVSVGSLTSTGAITAASFATTGGVSTGALTVTSLNSNGAVVAGTLTVNSTATMTGLLTATGGLTTPGAINTGTLTATSNINANGGLTVPAGKTLTANGPINAGAGMVVTAAGNSGVLLGGQGNPVQFTAWGMTFAAGGLSVTGSGATVGTAAAPQPLTVHGLLTANGGLTVPTGQTVTINGTLVAGTTNTGALTAGGSLNANGGITIPAGFNLDVGGTTTAIGLITAYGGVTVPAGKAVTASGAVSLAPSSRTGIRFDKNLAQYADLPNIPATVDFASGIMIQTWIYLHSLDDFAKIIDFWNAGTATNNLSFYVLSTGALVVQVNNVTTNAVAQSPPNTLMTNVWTHVAMTIDTAGFVRLYRNGAQVWGSGAFALNNVVRSQNRIGRSSSKNHPYLNAILSDLSVWSGAQVPIMSALAGNEAGLVGYWKLYDGTMTTDSCTNAIHLGNATLQNSPGASPGFGLTWDVGRAAVTIAQASIGSISGSIPQDDWTNATLINNWTVWNVGFNPPGYFRDSLGIVHLRGVLNTNTFAKTAFTLPAGYRPRFNELFVCSTSLNTCGNIDIVPDGSVVPNSSGSASWFSLDGITFRAYQ